MGVRDPLERPRVHEHTWRLWQTLGPKEAHIVLDHDPFSLLLPRKGYTEDITSVGTGPKTQHVKEGGTFPKNDVKTRGCSRCNRNTIVNSMGLKGLVSH
jgi:hypothetical protein